MTSARTGGGDVQPNPDEQVSDRDALRDLSTRRAGLLSQIEEKKATLRDAVVQLDHIEATMRLFDPKIDFRILGARRDLQVEPAQYGETMRIVLAALAEAGRPVSTGALVDHIIFVRGLDRANSNLRRTLSKRLGSSLRYSAQTRGIIRSLPGPGQMKMWELAR